MRNSLHKSTFFIFLSLLCLAFSHQVFAQVSGDFKSNGSGPWGSPTTWQRFNGVAWELSGIGANNPGKTPTASNSVFIQTGHTVTLGGAGACNDLHLNAAAGSRLALGIHTLSVYGKMRAYIGAVDILPGTSTSTLPANSTWITSSTGKLSIVGDSRVLTAMGEWGSGNASTASPSGFDFELNLNAGQIVTANTGIKARSFTIAEGTLKVAGNHRLVPDSGVAGGNFTIESGGALESDATGVADNAVIGRNVSAIGTLQINSGGVLRLSGAAPTIGMSTITNNGTVEYSGAGNQAMVVATNFGAAMPTYTNLALSGGGIKALTSATSVSGNLTVAANTVLNNGGFNLTLTSDGDYAVEGIITGSGSLIKTGTGLLGFLSGTSNNTNHTYTGGTTVSSGTINVSGLSGIISASIGSSAQSITFSSAAPTVGTYQLLPGSLSVNTESFTHNGNSSRKVTFDYSNSTVTVAEASIATSSISPSGYCVGSNVIVAFTSDVPLSGTYTAQLSDASGSFSSPVDIGSGTSSPISALIPGAAFSGIGYRIRVVNTGNGTIGSDNGSNISVSGTIIVSVSTTDANCPTVSDGTATVNIVSGGVGPYTYNWVGYTTGPLHGQGGWNAGSIPNLVNANAGDMDVVNTVAHSGTQSWYYKKGYNSPGAGTPFTQVVASVGAPGSGAAGNQSIVEFSFKSATPGDSSVMSLYEGSISRNDRTGAQINIRNIGGGLVELYMSRAIAASPYTEAHILGSYPANDWHTVKMVTNYPETDSGDYASWGTTTYYVDGVEISSQPQWMHWWREKNGFAYTPGSSLKFAANNLGNGFYIDDISMIVNNTLTSQTVGSFSAGFESVSGSASSIEDLTAGAYQVNVTDANGCTASGSGVVGTSNGPVHNENRNTYFCRIQDAIDDALTVTGDIIRVAAGTYAENIEVTKSVSILGPNEGISPNTGSRVAEAIIVPSVVAAGGEVITVKASDVRIDGLTIDGDNPLLSSTWAGTNGADIDAAEAVTVYVANINNLVVTNNIIQNLGYFGVTLYGTSTAEANTSKTGHEIKNNLIRNMGHYGTGNGNDLCGGGVLLYNSHYANISNNVMQNVRTGIQTGNFQAQHIGDPQFTIIDGNNIQTRYMGIFYNLMRRSPWTISNNTITGINNATEAISASRPWRGMLLSSLGGPLMGQSTISNNNIDGSAISFAKEGINVWAVQPTASANISGGNITGVQTGINVNNFEGYTSNAGDNTSAVIDGVTIENASVTGILINDNPLNTNGKTVTAEVKNVTITGAPTSIFVSGADAGGNIHDNTITASGVGINVSGTAVSALNALAIQDNNITLSAQLSAAVPTVGISLTNIGGSQAATTVDNIISGSYYGYLAYNVNTAPVTKITGGSVNGIMQGFAMVNVDPITGSTFSPSAVDIDGVMFSGFIGDHPTQTGRNSHAGIYVFTGGNAPTAKITSNITNVSISGTGKISGDSAGMSFADFSTGAGNRQQISVTASNIFENANRGVNVRGANALVDIATSMISDNGNDPVGTDGNNGFGIVGRNSAVVNVHNNFINNPATSALSVTALRSDGAVITATENSFNNNGNTNGKLASASGTAIAATCNSWGADCSDIAGLMGANVTYKPFISSSLESDAAAGFQPDGSCDGDIATIGGVVPSAAAVCAGSTVSVTLSGLVNGMTEFTFEVDGVSDTESVEVTDGTAVLASNIYAEGSHEVEILSANIGGCATSFSINNTTTFTVNETPTLGSVSSPPTCVGNPISVEFTGLRPNTEGTITISPDGNITQDLPFSADPSGNYTISDASAVAEQNGVTIHVLKVTESATNCELVFALNERSFTFVVNPSLSVSYPAGVSVYTEGSAITPISPTSTGLDISYSAVLPAGLQIDPVTGVISGTPTTPTAQNSYMITATNACGSASASVVMTVNAIPFAGGGCALVNEDFDTAPQLANSNVNGAWYPDRYRPAGFESNGSQLQMTISGADGAQLRPSAYSGTFYNAQGRKINQCSGCVTIAKADLYIPADWATNKRRADLWATAFNGSNAVSLYPIIGFRNTTGNNPNMSLYNNGVWIELGPPAAYDTSYSLEMRLNGANLEYFINGANVGSIPALGSVYFGDIILQGYNFNDNTLGVSYDASANNSYNVLWDNVSTASSTGNVVTNTNTGNSFCSIQGAINDATTLAGHTLEIGQGTYNEQVLVNKAVIIKGNDANQPIVDFTGTVSGKPTLFDVSVDGVTIENINFNVDLSKLRSAVIASASGLDNITVKDNVIDAYGTPAGSYGDRNAVNVNYTGATNYRVASGGVNNVVFTGNTVSGTAPASYFRAGIALDEGGLTATGNTITSINHDVLLRFSSNGASTISNNIFNGGGVELAEQNASAGPITVSGNTFTGAGAPSAALLRVRNNQQNTPYLISGNQFSNFDWAVSLENMNTVTLDNNTFTGLSASSRAVVVNTKSISSNSHTIVQTSNAATFTNNSFGGQGIGLTFQNHDSDNDSYGTFTIGTAGNENSFSSSLTDFIHFDNQTGQSNVAAFPAYPGNIAATTMACWNQNIDIQNNNFDLGSGMQLPASMGIAERETLEEKLFNKPDDACTGILVYYLPVTNITQNTKHLSITEAIAAANANDVLSVAQGVYAEDIIVNKSLTILGPNAGVNPNGGTRVDESILVPATQSVTGKVVTVRASNVTLDGLTFNGDNPAISSGWAGTNGADIDAGEAVGINVANINNVIVRNNIITNFAYFGISFYGGVDSEANTSKTGHEITNNLIKDMGHYNTGNGYDSWGGGVLLYNSHYTNISNNVMTNVRIGIQTGNFQKAHVGAPQYMVMDNNQIATRYIGIFYNLQRFSPWTISNNTITAYDSPLQASLTTRTWKGILFGSLGNNMGLSNISNNIIDGSGAVSFAGRREGMNVWNVNPNSRVNINGGTISGVDTGINVNNFDGYASNAADHTGAIIDGVTITGATVAGILINDNPLNTNSRSVTAEVKNTTVSGSPASILVRGADAGGDIHNNTINAESIGIGVAGSVLSATNILNIEDNSVTVADQLAGGNPTVGISITDVSGSQAATAAGNTISGSYYGYLAYDVNTTPLSAITGGTISGVMQGLAIVNVNPLNNSELASSTVLVDGVAMSGFAGDHPAVTGRNFHAGIYVYTAGGNPSEKITATISNMNISGTGKISADSAGMSFADFSTGAGVRQDVSVFASDISNNINRGINARGGNTSIDIATSSLTDNGSDPIGGVNHGFGILGRVNAVMNIHNNFITNPQSSTLSVTAIGSDGAAITASENSLDNNNNSNGKLVISSVGASVDAACNTWGVDCLEIEGLTAGPVTFKPFIASSNGNDADGAEGFQPAPGACDGDIATLGGVAATASEVCEGTSQNINMSGLTNGVTDFVYNVNNGTPISLNGVDVTDGTASFAADFGVGTYEIVITSASIGGCETPFTTNNAVTFTVKPNPSISGVSPSEASVCEGTPVGFTATGLLDGLTDFAYTINGDPFTITAEVSGGASTFAAAAYPVGTYEVVITSATVNGCTTTFTADNATIFTVNAVPTLASVTADAVCEGNSTNIVLSGLLPNSTGVATYTLNGDGPLTQAFTAEPNGTFTFATPVLSMEENGLVVEITQLTNDGTECSASFTGKTVSLGVQPNANAGTDGAISVCDGVTPTEEQLFEALGGAPDAGGSWSHVGEVYTYTVNATSPCVAADTATVTVTVNALPSPVITGINTLNCANPTSILDAGSYASYVWTPGGETTQTITTIANTTQVYGVTVTDNNGCSSSASYAVTYYPVTNISTGADYFTIQAAITAANANDVINVCAGTYTETININKALTINGPNVGTPGTGTRVPEAILLNCTLDINNSGNTMLDGLHIKRTNDVALDQIIMDGAGTNSIQNSIFERTGTATGVVARAITTSAGGGVKNILYNLFTGDGSNLFSGHKTWNNGIYVNGGAAVVNISGNTIMNTRSAMNIDNYTNNVVTAGNTFNNNGTHISLGGTAPTTGSFELGANDFINNVSSTMINLSNVADDFRLDMTSSTLNGVSFGSLSDAQLFEVEARMYHKGNASRKGKVIYKSGNQYVNNLSGKIDVIQNSVKYADANDIINLQAGIYPQNVNIDKSNITVQGVEGTRAWYVLNGSALAAGTNGVNIQNGRTHVSVKNLTITGFTGGSGNTNGDVFANGGNNNLTIDNVAAISPRGASGIFINGLGGIENVTVNGCLVRDHGPGARGIVIWNGFKKNIAFTNNEVYNNNCCGIELADGTASGVTIFGNTINIGNGDNAIGVVGLNTSFGPNTISYNNITGGGRFGIELKNPDGATVNNNIVHMDYANADVRDRAGIAVIRRAYLAADSNGVNVPNEVTVHANHIVGYTQSSSSDGYGIVIEGTNHTVTDNEIYFTDIAVQQQAGNGPYTGLGSDDGDQNDKVDNYFGRGNSPVVCNVTVSGNQYFDNGINERIVTGGGVGTIVTTVTPTVDEPADLVHCAGEQTETTFTGNALPGVVYNWTNDNTNTGLAASGTGNITVATVNTTGVTQVSTVVVTPVANGCAGTPQTFTITIKPNPTIAGVSPSAASVCEGTSVTFTAAGLTNGNTDFTYTINGVEGTETIDVVDGTAVFAAANSAAGTYDVVITSATIDGCTMTFTSDNAASFTIHAYPTLDGVSLSSAIICDGEAVSFTAAGLLNGTTDFSYTINGTPGTEQAMVTDGTHTFASAVYPVGDYNLVIVSATVNGCTTTFLADNQTSFTVHPNLTPVFTQVQPICEGGSFTLPTMSDNGIEGSWSPSIDNTLTTTYTFTPSVETCTASPTMTVVVNPLPDTPVLSYDPVCIGADLHLSSDYIAPQGYTMNASSGVAFIDITATGTPVSGLDDDSIHNITMPAFNFNGVSYTALRVGNNGIISIGSDYGYTGSIYTNQSLPTVGGPGETFLAPFWDDLYPLAANSIMTKTEGDLFIVQFREEASYGNVFENSNNNSISFQVQLNKVTGEINYVYQDVHFNNPTYDYGANATVGIQYNGSSALQFSFDTASLVNGQSITFTPPSADTFAWTGPNSFTSDLANPILENVTQSEAGTYSLIVTNPSTGCSSMQGSIDVIVDPLIVPAFTQIEAICSGAIFTLPATSEDGITGTWLPAQDNTATTEYTFTPDPDQCATTTTMNVVVYPNPTLSSVNTVAVCDGQPTNIVLSGLLPNTSGVAAYTVAGSGELTMNYIADEDGSFTISLPALTMAENGQEYDFIRLTDDLTGCETIFTDKSVALVVNPNITPTFDAVPAICSGDFLAELPTTSVNGYTGTWSPAIDNTATTEYTFTPDGAQCATTTTLTIVVNPISTPTFDPVAAICNGEVINPLPVVSNNGFTGSWSPALNNQATTTYVFTPDGDQCATSAIMTIAVNPIITPVFDSVPATCATDPMEELPAISNNGVTGTWSPELNNLETTLYTFTPDPGQCANTTTLTIVIIPVAIPQFNEVDPIYAGDTLNPLPTTSLDGYVGTWSPALNNMETTTYAFTPTEGQCATTSILTIEVIPNDSSIGAGDFRSRASGSWAVPTTWERYNGNIWEAAGVGSNNPGQIPSATSSVYIQTGNNVTLTSNSACNDLHLNAASGSRLALGTFTLNVNGKLRAYTGIFNDVPGTSTATLPGGAGWISSTTGKLSIVGDSRELTAAGEWGSGNAGTSSPTGFNFELNLNAGQTATVNTGIKARAFNIAAGTLKVGGNNRLAPDTGSAAGSFTIQSGAAVESDASGTGSTAVIGRSATALGGTLQINAGGTLKLTGAAPTIGMTSVINNGTVAYTASVDQNLVAAVNAGAAMASYYNVILSGGGTKSMATTTTVTGNITVDANTILNNGGMNLAIISDLDNTIAGVISGGGDLVQYGTGAITLTAANGNNTAHTYGGQTVVGANGLNITGLNEITAMTISSTAQAVVFDSATPENGTYQVLPGAVAVSMQNFSSSPATPTKLVTFDYSSSTITVSEAVITTEVISPITYCAGDEVSVGFSSDVELDGTYTAQLSDASGNFDEAVAIGSGVSSPISANIPQGTAAGSGYRIRVVSSNAIIGSDNGSDIVINDATVPTFTAVEPQCTGAPIAALPTTSNNGITGAWSPAINNTATTTYTFTPDAGQCAAPTSMTITVGVCESIVNLKLFVQGYYTGSGSMASVKFNQDEVSPEDEVEDLTIELRDATTKALVASTQATLYTDGTLTSIFSSAPTGSFYIVVKGQNLVQTWSATPQAIGFTPLNYDFSAAESQAYTDGTQPSVVEVEPGVWGMYSGDVNQDEIVDPMDTSNVSNASDSAQYGVLTTDLTGDGMVDSFDFSLVSNNADAVIYTQRP